MGHRLRPLPILITLCLGCLHNHAHAVDPASAKATLNLLSHINHASLSEPSGSRGSFGVQLGIAYQNIETDPEAVHTLSALVDESELASVDTTRIIMLRGTPWPIDFGASLGQIQNTNIATGALFSQITIYEELGWPSLGVRYHYSQIIGMRQTEVREQGVDVLASKSLLGILSLYAGYGVAEQEISFQSEASTSLGLTSQGDDKWRQERQHMQMFGGFKIILDGRFDAVGEYAVDENKLSSWTAKLNILM
jgi:hypothetical protein